MIKTHWLNWRTVLAFVAVLIVCGTVFYSQYLARKISREEKQKIEEWVDANSALLSSNNSGDTKLPLKIIQDNEDIPIIATNEKDSIVDYMNYSSDEVAKDSLFLYKKLKQLKNENKPVVWQDPFDHTKRNYYYYGNTPLLAEVQYFPLLQLIFVAMFIGVVIIAQLNRFRSTQNQVWAGMAKETAHQLGTPVSSLEGWVEMLKEINDAEYIANEIEKDVKRLQLISDRFGKIGSMPQLEPKNIVVQIQHMVDYMKRRAGAKIEMSFYAHDKTDVVAFISPPLFDWVIENLLKNALDAMEGKGHINVELTENNTHIYIDVTDTGKGISKANIDKVFKPGFTTKKRGWGLGLTLTQRIVEKYHKGKIFVKHSEIGKGTTFRIVLNK